MSQKQFALFGIVNRQMNIQYTLEPFSDAIRDAYLDLLPEQEQMVARGKLEWKLRDNPHGPGLVAIAREGDQILGVNAFMAGTFKVGEESVRGYQSMDTIVMPAARGKGVFSKLINCFYDQTDGSLLYGFPNLNSSPGFFGKLGWTYLGAVPMLIRPLRAGYFLKRVSPLLPDFRLPLLSRRDRNAEPLQRFDSSATDLWRRFSAGVGCAVERDADYLNWRLVDHPAERYSIIRGADGSFAASTVSEKHGGRIGYVMEAIGPTKSLVPLIGASLHDMRDQGADAALAWCLPSSPNYAAYRRAGFYPFPARLRPILINFGARPTGAADMRITEPRSWYVSYLDSDTV